MTIIMTEEEKREAWAAGRTDVHAVATEADCLIREARETLAASARRDRRRPPVRRESEEEIDFLYGDVGSGFKGRELGRRFNHDPYQLAASLKIPVWRVPLEELWDPTRPSLIIDGVYTRETAHPNRGFIRLREGQSPQEEVRMLAHEVAHALGFKIEEHANRFAAAFLKVEDNETAAGRWREIQDDLNRRARQDAIARARVLDAAARGRY